MTRLFSSILFLAVLSIGTGGCSSSNSATTDLDDSSIPDTAYEIHIYSQKSPEDYLGYIRRRLESEGFNIGDFSIEKRTVWGTRPQIGRGLSLTVFASTDYDEVAGQTFARVSGVLGDERGIARWSTSDDEQAFAFKEMLRYCQNMEHEQLVFAVQQ